MSQVDGKHRQFVLAVVVFLALAATACGSDDEVPLEIEGVDIVSGIEIGQGSPAMALVVRSEEQPAHFPPVEIQSGAVYVTVIYDVSFSNWPEIAPDPKFESRNERLRHDWERSKSLCVMRAFLEDNACGTFVADYDLQTGQLEKLIKTDVAAGKVQILVGEDLTVWDFKEDLEELIAICTDDLGARAAANDGWLKGETPDSCFKALTTLSGGA